MRISNLKALVLPLALALVSGVAASAQIVKDGNFNWSGSGFSYQSGGSVPGDTWTFTGGSGIQSNGSAWGFSNAPEGAGQTAFLQSYPTSQTSLPTGQPYSTISQTVNGLTVGDTYTLSFYLEQRPGNGQNPVTVSVGSTAYSAVTPTGSGWDLYTDTFTATSTSELLTFSVYNPQSGDNDTGLAGVSIHVPEGGASSLYALLAGLVCFGAIFTSRKGLTNRA
jgi:hypothetical protein